MGGRRNSFVVIKMQIHGCVRPYPTTYIWLGKAIPKALASSVTLLAVHDNP